MYNRTRHYWSAGLKAALVLTTLATIPAQAGTAVATFAGGCFWCMEPPFDNLDGVISTTSGYIAGHKDNPTYREVAAGITGHTEAVQIKYDPDKVSYQTLLDVFWVNIDPYAVNRQFCDTGSQYRTGIYTHNEEQLRLAKASKTNIANKLNASGRIATEVIPATQFYPAEDYHQDYYLNNPVRYTFYRYNCGRDKRLKQVWGEKYQKP
ncbi:peptide-methionine (S)-S-oxide reductase MsrA [Oceanospirillum sediminis]|uniref:Peptide methionine sulfoxide reductase MsrA n=1 Tax=Oceanospirillum sediminis TaxID=2760088 RepID=A0A839IYK8_9GAMM|nr:peptide-methionine (S)-S-oxide reductase MsrA [Oceanospirillum sediminis]MBB1489457.1 peptide-methionine (S)-S-oxide reductase MsrA [Oceanospirillum sediminis]